MIWLINLSQGNIRESENKLFDKNVQLKKKIENEFNSKIQQNIGALF